MEFRYTDITNLENEVHISLRTMKISSENLRNSAPIPLLSSPKTTHSEEHYVPCQSIENLMKTLNMNQETYQYSFLSKDH